MLHIILDELHWGIETGPLPKLEEVGQCKRHIVDAMFNSSAFIKEMSEEVPLSFQRFKDIQEFAERKGYNTEELTHILCEYIQEQGTYKDA
jgi:hypothetical protein